MTPAMVFKAVPRGMLIAVAIAFVLLNGLGIWQLQRMAWKEGIIAAMARTEAMSPVPAEQLLAQATPAWRSASVACTVQPGHFIYMHSEVDGLPGYRVLTACPLKDGALLVDLGFVGDKIALPTMSIGAVGRLRPFDKPGMVTPVNRPADNDWYWRIPSEMGKALGISVRGDYFLVVDLSASHVSIPGLQQGPLNAQVSVPPERHMEYALTWFGLGWLMLGMFVAFAWQRARGT